MEVNNGYSSSYGTSWAEQWDYGQDTTVHRDSWKSGGGGGKAGTGKYKEKAGQGGFEKTKSVASVGFNKVKEGTSSGFNWLKHKYQKTRNNNNNNNH